jgi:hypothetical protein
MSQHRNAMLLIERQSGLIGRVVRPLCARLLPPSLPEQQGLIDSRRFEAIQGRCRRPQFRLAEKLGVKDYLCPAGGCLLTDPEFAARFKELLDHDPDFGASDARLLRLGRHFRLPDGSKAVVGRDEKENNAIERAAQADNLLLLPEEVPGPSVLCRGRVSDKGLRAAAALLATYTTKRGPRMTVRLSSGSNLKHGRIIEDVQPLDRAYAYQWQIRAGKP